MYELCSHISMINIHFTKCTWSCVNNNAQVLQHICRCEKTSWSAGLPGHFVPTESVCTVSTMLAEKPDLPHLPVPCHLKRTWNRYIELANHTQCQVLSGDFVPASDTVTASTSVTVSLSPWSTWRFPMDVSLMLKTWSHTMEILLP